MTSDDGLLEFRPNKSSSARKWSTIAGAVIGLAGAAFVARSLLRDRDEIAQALSHAKPAYLLVALALVGLAMTGIGLAWRAWVRVLGGEIDTASSLRGYFVGQLGKYLPGGIWAIMGRSEWARSEGVPGGIAYSSAMLSVGSAFLAAVMLAAVVSPFSGLLGSNGDQRYLLVLLLLPFGFTLLNPIVLGGVLTLLRRITKRDIAIDVPSWGESTVIVLRQLPSWVLIGTASWVIALAFGSRGEVFNILFAASVSWVIGFIALPVPGGIGVREAVFVALATSLSPGIAATVAVTARLVTILVDVGGAGSSTLFLGRRNRKLERR